MHAWLLALAAAPQSCVPRAVYPELCDRGWLLGSLTLWDGCRDGGVELMRVLAEVERSGFVESRHDGIVVVADADGEVLTAAGDPEEVVYARSCSKPFQALAVYSLG
ncbi:MAG TPA: asparaginase, partial [Actinomycetota bacterium]